jgi:hypothetical protein
MRACAIGSSIDNPVPTYIYTHAGEYPDKSRVDC